MMRRVLASLALLAACAAHVVDVSVAAGSEATAGTRAGSRGLGAASPQRSWPVSLAAAPADLALAQVSFPRAARGASLAGGSLTVAVRGAFGDDYLAAGALRLSTSAAPRALVLLVNRASPLLDPVSVHLELIARDALGAPVMHRLADPFTHPGERRPAVCELPLHGSALSGSEVRLLRSRGRALTGFDAPGAIAQAYDVVCALPHASSFARAVGQPPPAPPSPGPAPPSPGPPVSAPPGCTPCDPRPGYACPLAVQPDICAVSAAPGARRVATAAH